MPWMSTVSMLSRIQYLFEFPIVIRTHSWSLSLTPPTQSERLVWALRVSVRPALSTAFSWVSAQTVVWVLSAQKPRTQRLIIHLCLCVLLVSFPSFCLLHSGRFRDEWRQRRETLPDAWQSTQSPEEKEQNRSAIVRPQVVCEGVTLRQRMTGAQVGCTSR